MSDLAPFVAAAIRDRTVMDLQKEVAKLQEENSALKAKLSTEISLVGPDGVTIYGRGDFKKGHQPHIEFCYIDLNKDSTFPMCPAADVENCQVKIGGSTKVILIGPRSGGTWEEYGKHGELGDFWRENYPEDPDLIFEFDVHFKDGDKSKKYYKFKCVFLRRPQILDWFWKTAVENKIDHP